METDAILEKLINLYISYRKRYVLEIPGGGIFTPKRKTGDFCPLTNGVLRNH